jgi:signal peptidase I
MNMMRNRRKPATRRKIFGIYPFSRRKKRFERRPVITTLFWLAVTIGLLVIFAPVQIGGQVGYIIVSGNSMMPNFEYHDLVMTWQAENYQLGDVIAYNDPILGGIVFHRIVEIDQDLFQTKGDNNNWLDLYRPNQNDIIGRSWVHFPGMGEYVVLLNQPGPFSLIVAIFILLLFGPSLSPGKQIRIRR